MYGLVIKSEVDKLFRKLSKKDKKQMAIIKKKIQDIINNPNHKYKFLRKPFQNLNRAHIDKNNVLIFSVDHDNRIVRILRYDHHDSVYSNVLSKYEHSFTYNPD